ncbi:hypothetical protein BKA62DRAFT_712618 [Auriculariales sp. MPI-PUGE-AT-0066]|nr:hypothetical protein BKA62DRAFT_712618 [Auriculariales sp. MPI-PUGE-AT-0066]
MLSRFVGGPKATMSIVPYQSVLFIHPPKEFEHLDEEDAPPKDQLLTGNVKLVLPKPREFTSLTIKLVAYYTLSIPGYSTENGVLAEFPCKINIPKRLDEGEHTFPWSLNVPRTSAPYERCAYGRVYHKLQGIAEGPGGPLKDDTVLEVVVNPADEGETLGLNERVEGFSAEIGPYLASLTSGHVTVAGAVHYKLNLPSVPEDTRIQSITGSIIQSYQLRSHTRPGVTGTPQPHVRRVFRLDASTPRQQHGSVTPPAGGGVQKMDLSANPRRPATVVLSKSPTPPGENLLAFIPKGESLEVSHHKRLLALRVERPMNMSSCCCMLESLLLPSYNEVQDASDLADGLRGRDYRLGCSIQCLCGYTLDKLLSKQHAPVLKAHMDAAAGNDHGGSDEIFASNKIAAPPSYAQHLNGSLP